jgi:hypothetical protein
MKTSAHLLILPVLPVSYAAAGDGYKHSMDLCEQAKRASDFARRAPENLSPTPRYNSLKPVPAKCPSSGRLGSLSSYLAVLFHFC